METRVGLESAPNRVTVEELALARALEACLEAIEREETDLDGLAARYPEARDEIRPLLEIARELKQRRAVGTLLPLEFKEDLRSRLAAASHNG